MSTETKDAPAFDFYPERWLVGTAHMSDAEQLSYLRLLCHQWLTQGLPADEKALKRLAGRGVTEVVIAKLPLDPDGKRRNKRLEVVRLEQRERIKKSREKIAKMNEARLKRHSQEALQDSDDVKNSKKNHRAGDKSFTEKESSTFQASKSVSGSSSTQPPSLVEPLKMPLESLLTASSPLTTHHSPISNIQQLQQRARGAPTGVEEALAYAKQFMSPNAAGLNATNEIVQAWHDARASIGWITVRGQAELPIADWQADLKGFIRKWNQNERSVPQPGATASNVVRMPQAQKAPTVWELKQRIEAADAQIGKIRGIHLTKNLSTAKQEEIHKLRDSIATWRKQITEQGG